MSHQIVAAVQMNSSPIVADNLLCAAQLIAQAAAKKAMLIVLPEMFASMTSNTTVKCPAGEEFGYGPIQDFLALQARRHQLWLVAGTIPIRDKLTHKLRAACLVFNAQGEVVARYDKMHLFDVLVEDERYQESATWDAGDQVVVVDTPVGKLGLAVCYDIRFPELFRVMFNRGAEIFAAPTAFTVPTGKAHWEILTRSRAIENFSYFIGACQVGEHEGKRQTYGHSLIIDPWGEVLNILADKEVGVVTAEVNLQHLHEIRQRLPVAQHQKIFSTR